jgi:hypothetical protein
MAALAVLAAVGCGATEPVVPSVTETVPEQDCSGLVTAISGAVSDYVAVYALDPSAQAEASGEQAGQRLQQTLQNTYQQLSSAQCDQRAFLADLKADLAAVPADGVIAQAVLSRLSANITGEISTAKTIRVTPKADLHQVVAQAAPGAVLELQKGSYALSQPLVLLDGVVLRGEGAKRTVISSTAPDAALLVLAGDVVTLEQLSIIRDAGVPGSGVIASAASLLRLSAVNISGARAAADTSGGAGVDMSSSETLENVGTTLEITDSTFSSNSYAGVSVGGTHQVSIVGSSFSKNSQCGICFLGAASGSVEKSKFNSNGIGIAAVGDSDPLLTATTFTAGDVGIQIGDRSRATVDAVTISKAKKAAIIVAGTATPIIRKAKCSQVAYGIVLSSEALPSLIDNTCTVAKAASKEK